MQNFIELTNLTDEEIDSLFTHKTTPTYTTITIPTKFYCEICGNDTDNSDEVCDSCEADFNDEMDLFEGGC